MDPAYSAILARCVLETAGQGVDNRVLLREAALPETVLTSEHGMISSRGYLRLWECTEHHQDASEVGLRIADTYRIGRFGIYDYLFATAPTVAAGLAAVRPHGGSMTTNHIYDVNEGGDGDERTTVLQLVEGEGRGAHLTVQAAYASTLARIRHTSGEPVTPIRITLRENPPRRLRAYREALGTTRIEFGAPVDSMTFRTRDLALPLRTADPVLAEILRRYADSLSTPILDGVPWTERVQRCLAEALQTGDASLGTVARCLLVSPRTLQRRLAESGTSWRQELDRARCAATEQSAATVPSVAALARRVGYSDARALRRARRRWQDVPRADGMRAVIPAKDQMDSIAMTKTVIASAPHAAAAIDPLRR
ncbi:AraC-like DNA-binding protein [Nocardia sp. GAS34]|uniref:AraC family transcriptional regulator ligand-binding domain-containing protein n=1 Tax=unclassified Nocardia TaxID=2637762 RepID=UPI003D263DE6